MTSYIPQRDRDYLSELPNELIWHILSFVGPKDVNKLAQVSAFWKEVSNNSVIWQNICLKFKIIVQAATDGKS
jgi:hypothetical protein